MKKITISKETKEKYLKRILRGLQWFVISMAWLVHVSLILMMFVVPFWIIIYPTLILIIKLIVKIKHMQFHGFVEQNTIIHGGRGKGKGLLFQFSINHQKKANVNIPYGPNTDVLQPIEYFNSIKPNDSEKMVEGQVTVINKRKEWEGVPYYLDDTAVYFPNYNDNQLKKIYPSMSLFIPIQRHLYNTYTVINVQDINRVYKILRELQTDGYIKALKTIGKGYIWSKLPVFRKYMVVKYRYHENIDSAINNRLPFEKMGIINRATEGVLTTTPSALKEMYQGQNGVIKDGFIFIKKKHLYYDTRHFHEKMFGYKA